MEKLNKYRKQIVTFITIFLLVTYGIFPALTAADTLLNILGFVGSLLLLGWGALELVELYKRPSEIETTIKEDLNEVSTMKAKPKRKYNKKPKKSEYPLPPHNLITKKTK